MTILQPQSKPQHETHTGRFGYVRLSVRENAIRFYITKDGREEVRNQRKSFPNKPDLHVFIDLIQDDFLCNGWTEVRPEQVGDMRDSSWLVLSRDCTYESEEDDDNMIVGVAYSYSQYAIESYITPLLGKGYIEFGKHVYLTEREMQYQIARHRPDCFDTENERQLLLDEADQFYAARAAADEARRAEWAGQKAIRFEPTLALAHSA